MTSAPQVPAEPARAPMAPQAPTKAAVKPDSAPNPPSSAVAARPRMASVDTSANDFKPRKDRAKSPGFYSSVSSANGVRAAAPGFPSSTNLAKATVMGLAPPAAPASAKAAEPRVAQPPAAEAHAADAAPPVPALDLTSSSKAVVTEEKEDTSPGLGHVRSRHDPAVRGELPESDLDLLVEFIMDLAIGPVSDTWQAPIRAAVTRLKDAATKKQRAALEKALGHFSAELERSGNLSDERRSRLVQQFVAVDIALPRPVDIAKKRILRERLIVEQLLAEVAAMQPLLAQRLRDEGFVSLERFARSSAAELSEKVQASPDQAEQVLTTFQSYLLARSQRGPELAVLGKSGALKKRLSALEVSAEQFERACDDDDSEARRLARRQRTIDVTQMNLFLAERGEASILSEIERCSVQGKIDRLRRWLTELEAG